jgi:hypothetical protein
LFAPCRDAEIAERSAGYSAAHFTDGYPHLPLSGDYERNTFSFKIAEDPFLPRMQSISGGADGRGNRFVLFHARRKIVQKAQKYFADYEQNKAKRLRRNLLFLKKY